MPDRRPWNISTDCKSIHCRHPPHTLLRAKKEASDEVNLRGQGQIAVSICGEGEEIEENEEIRNTRIKMEK